MGMAMPGTWIPDGSVTPAKLAEGTMRMVANEVLTGAATTVSFTGLSIDTSKHYILVYDLKTGAAGANIFIFVNADTTVTNYYSQLIDCDAAVLGGNRYNSPMVAWVNANGRESGFAHIFLGVDDYFRCIAQNQRYTGASVRVTQYATCKTGTTADITQIDITSSAANHLVAGSRFTLYEVDY